MLKRSKNIILFRGVPPFVDDRISILNAFAVSHYPFQNLSRAIFFDDDGCLNEYQDDEKTKLELQECGVDFEYQYSDFLKLIFFCPSFDQAFNLEDRISQKEEEILWLPAFGLKDGVWYDGPIVHAKEGRLLSYIPKGCPAFYVPEFLKGSDGFCPPPYFSIKNDTEVLLQDRQEKFNSLCYATRFLYKGFPFRGSEVLEISDFSLASLVALVVLRTSGLRSGIFIWHPDCQYKKWPFAWKRVAQNIGISLYEMKKPKGEYDFHLKLLADLIPKGEVVNLAKEINRYSDIIPRKFIESS